MELFAPGNHLVVVEIVVVDRRTFWQRSVSHRNQQIKGHMEILTDSTLEAFVDSLKNILEEKKKLKIVVLSGKSCL